MRITNSPEALPGSCFVCGSASRSSYVDPNISMDFHGAIYLCVLCFEEGANLLGFAPPERLKACVNEIEQLKTEVYNLKRQLDGMEMVINGFTLARGVSGIDSIGSYELPVADLVEPSTDESPSREEPVGAGEVKPAGQVHDEGVAKLPDDAESEFRLDF